MSKIEDLCLAVAAYERAKSSFDDKKKQVDATEKNFNTQRAELQICTNELNSAEERVLRVAVNS